MRVRIAVSFELPEGASREEALDYVVDAVQTWKGSLRPPGAYGPDDPGNPMFDLDYETVRGTCSGYRGNKRYILRSPE